MIRAQRIGITAVAVLVMAGAAPVSAPAQQPSGVRSFTAAADSDGGLPPGWRITGEGTERQLVWRSDAPVPMGDARIEFYAGSRLLGRPQPGRDGHTFRLDLNKARSTDLHGLHVRASGKRLDTAGRTARPRDDESPSGVRPPARLPAGSVDPGKPGPYRTATGEYSLDPVRLPEFPKPVEMRAVVVAPKGAAGRRPVALFLHGRHYTCYKPHGDATGDWPCPSGTKQIPSYRGYLQDQRLLASQGYVTVSISANGINGQDDVEDGGAQARSSLVRQHLSRWADWAAHPASAPKVVRQAPRPDLSRVLLVGHSRGGEGVNRAAMDSLSPPPADQDGAPGPVRWHIRGTVLIGPTIFGQNPVADVPSVTILPGCDGDVSDLQGEIYVDGTRGVSRGTALHSAVYMVGADHNFFNTEWTPGKAQAPAEDDFGDDPDHPDPVCSPSAKTRLTADQQHQAGATYIAAAARLFVAGDDRARPLLDGSGHRAPSADPARVLTHAVGARRTGGLLPDGPVSVTGGRLCSAVDPKPSAACLGPDTAGASPHFAQWETERETGRRAVALRWSAAGSAVRVRPSAPVSLHGAKDLALRVIVPPNTTGTKLDVSLTDASGHRATLGRVRADGLPGSEQTASYWARELRVPLTAATRAGLDLRHVRTLELTPRTRSGRAWLMDAWGWRAGTPAVRAAAMPRVDIGRLTVKEGDSGTRTYRVPVRVSGHGSGQLRLYDIDPATGRTTNRLVTVRPGGHDIDVPVKVEGNTRYGEDIAHDVLVKAVRSAVIGSYRGGVTATNDDPSPEITVSPLADRVKEGKRLKWRVNLSAVADTDVPVAFTVRPPTTGPELSTKDVGARWLQENSGASPDPERPLSKLDYLTLWSSVPAGRRSLDVTVPTVKDRVEEQAETVRFQLADNDTGEPQDGGPVLTGTVLDAS